MQAEANAKLGLLKESLKCLDEAAHHIEKTNERSLESELHRVRADVLRGAGDFDASEQSYLKAQAVARRQSARAYEIRSAVGLARLWGDQGKRDEARNLLAPVYGWFTEGFGTPVLREAKALLDTLA
jgi:predicted ATPase